MKKYPKLSIIIPVYNEGKNIERVIDSLNNQRYINFEIIIVDDGSTDNSLCYAEKYKKVKIIKQNHKGPGAARNLGAKNAKGDILIFVDADMTFDKDYLKFLTKPIIENGELGTEEEVQIAKNAEYNIWSRCLGKIISDPGVVNRKVYRAINKKRFLKLGGFDSKYGYADDQTLWLKHNLKPTIAKKAICYHDNPETLSSVYSQARWVGSSEMSFWMKIPFFKWLVIVLFFLASPIFIALLSIRKTFKTKNFRIFFPWMLIFTTVRYFGALAGYIRKILRGTNFR